MTPFAQMEGLVNSRPCLFAPHEGHEDTVLRTGSLTSDGRGTYLRIPCSTDCLGTRSAAMGKEVCLELPLVVETRCSVIW